MIGIRQLFDLMGFPHGLHEQVMPQRCATAVFPRQCRKLAPLEAVMLSQVCDLLPCSRLIGLLLAYLLGEFVFQIQPICGPKVLDVRARNGP